MMTEAPLRGELASSVTVPVTVFCCAEAGTEQRKIPIITMRILVFMRMYQIVVDAGGGTSAPAWSGPDRRQERETVRGTIARPSSLIVERLRREQRAPATR